jgi:hypothetical protein
VNSLEDRLRSAYQAAADTVAPDTVRGLPDLGDKPGCAPGGRRWAAFGQIWPSRRAASRAGRTRPSGRGLAIPLAAAAAVVAIAVSASIVAPRILSGQPASGQGPVGGLAQGYAGHRLPGTAAPKFFVAVQATGSDVQYATSLAVFSSAAGRVVGRLRLPVQNRYVQAVAALGSDRAFVVAASPGQRPGTGRTCGTWLYRFRLTPQGRPTGLTLLRPELPGFAQPNALAASADGSAVAYDTTECTQTKASLIRDYGQVGLLDVSSGRVKAWTYKSPATPYSLSLSADGSLVGMVSNPSNGARESSQEFNAAWVLRTTAAPGQLGRHYREVVGAPAFPLSAVLSPTGAVTFAALPRYFPKDAAHWHVTLAAYQTSTGRLIRPLRAARFGTLNGGLGITLDTSGRHLLMFNWNNRVQRVDLATGQLTVVPRVRTNWWVEGLAW